MTAMHTSEEHVEQILTDKRGRRFRRIELNGHWVEYRYLDAQGLVTHAIAFPRVPLIADDILADSAISE